MQGPGTPRDTVYRQTRAALPSRRLVPAALIQASCRAGTSHLQSGVPYRLLARCVCSCVSEACDCTGCVSLLHRTGVSVGCGVCVWGGGAGFLLQAAKYLGFTPLARMGFALPWTRSSRELNLCVCGASVAEAL